jgi:hypothetical protein
MATIAHADVSGSVTVTNSEGSFEESTTISNAVYQSVTILNPNDQYGGLPYSILSKGGGSSNSNSGEFSHSVTVNGGKGEGSINAQVETRNGAFNWNHNVNVGSINPGTSMGISTLIIDGKEHSTYSNDYSNAEKLIEVRNSKYFDNTLLTPNGVFSSGNGISIDADNAGNMFSFRLAGETAGRISTIDSGVEFFRPKQSPQDIQDTVSELTQWSDRVALTLDSGLISQRLHVLSNGNLQQDNKGDAELAFPWVSIPVIFQFTDSKSGSILEIEKGPDKDNWPYKLWIMPNSDEANKYLPELKSWKDIHSESTWMRPQNDHNLAIESST